MKVCIIDNTCNNGYVLMRYLNDRGLDTTLLLLHETSVHADPELDTYDRQYFDKLVWTHWCQRNYLWLPPREVKATLDRYAFVIGADYAPALCYRSQRTLDVFWPHGTDVFQYPFVRLTQLSRRNLGEWILARWQLAGIRSSVERFFFERTNTENEAYVERLQPARFTRVWRTLPVVYLPQYQGSAFEAYTAGCAPAQQLLQLRAGGHHIFFHHCQQQWKNPTHDLFNKGNDILIRAFARFLRADPARRCTLVMFERGTDVEESRQLVAQLGLEAQVLWFPPMPRKAIMACLQFCDLGIGELYRSWYSYSVATEFIAMAVPLIHHCDEEYYRSMHGDVYPMFTARREEEVAAHFEAWLAEPERYRQRGREAQQWWRRHVLEESLDYLLGLRKR